MEYLECGYKQLLWSTPEAYGMMAGTELTYGPGDSFMQPNLLKYVNQKQSSS